MNVAAMRVRILIQKNVSVTDKFGNHGSKWADYFSCWATPATSGRSAMETENAAHTQEANLLDFTVRWSTETAEVTSKEYRILLDGQLYDIYAIDEMGFKKHSRKFHTQLKAR